MKYLPYYISRAVISAGLSLLAFGLTWKAALFSGFLFLLFILYLHSGWFSVNADTPFMPLQRDSHGMEIQRKALIFAVIAGVLFYLISPYLSIWLSVALSKSISLTTGIIIYFCAQFFLFARK